MTSSDSKCLQYCIHSDDEVVSVDEDMPDKPQNTCRIQLEKESQCVDLSANETSFVCEDGFDGYDAEASLSDPIGAMGAPSCMTSVAGLSRVRPVSDGSDEAGSPDAGWTPDKSIPTTTSSEHNQQMLETYTDQARGIMALAIPLNEDVKAMFGRFRLKLESAGADVNTWDRAVAIASSTRSKDETKHEQAARDWFKKFKK